MSIFGSSAEFATIAGESAELIEVVDGRLKFKPGKFGVATAKFMVTDENFWRKIRLTYRRPGKLLRLENYIIARLNQIGKSTLEVDTLTFANTQNHVSDSEAIRTIGGVRTVLEPLNYDLFFYQIEIVLRRSSLLVPPEFGDTLEAIPSFGNPVAPITAQPPTVGSDKDELETPPPPSEYEINALRAMHSVAASFPRGSTFGVLTPSPEFILVELGTSAPGFG